ncbi:MAG TPA: hypothetical protein VN682_15560 [Terriglobales bacterium]|nr:hypothetical protein [Terriglobales bacterium]
MAYADVKRLTILRRLNQRLAAMIDLNEKHRNIAWNKSDVQIHSKLFKERRGATSDLEKFERPTV